jgi:hypothetical protein
VLLFWPIWAAMILVMLWLIVVAAVRYRRKFGHWLPRDDDDNFTNRRKTERHRLYEEVSESARLERERQQQLLETPNQDPNP